MKELRAVLLKTDYMTDPSTGRPRFGWILESGKGTCRRRLTALFGASADPARADAPVY